MSDEPRPAEGQPAGLSDELPLIRCGHVALVGRPNVGKSTLLNQLLGQKISIVTRKPQTTRQRILGVCHRDGAQIVYVDTPGLHQRRDKALNRYLNRTAANALADVDLVVFLVDRLHFKPEDEAVLERLKRRDVPVILAINKVDRLRDKAQLLPHIQWLSEQHPFVEVVPLSALKGENLAPLEEAILRQLPESPPLFPEDYITDRGPRFRIAELIREQLMRHLGEELPYATAVEVEAMDQEGQLTRISALIWVERPGQKAIVIGDGGQRLKVIGSRARQEIQQLLGGRVFLQLWVKVREGWSDDERALQSLGYEGD
ncbi:GTPase Era [Alkalilimnicola ehrlichii MLHE-1]|uniref:GTPase Era n=1 Tax=Alkalilimnicola ehrlichii (strain ATCC BAA-1101 / DSM 17681 / MLHE-1) TaxID=187272 RepID=Q0A8Z0_ALKEH|nr:GTPase Era [Alkalilimnicola ehrlichii]ABI56697.1 GTP-binding protein Era [Alkalilimnicola ehrlichii MLHE-1]